MDDELRLDVIANEDHDPGWSQDGAADPVVEGAHVLWRHPPDELFPGLVHEHPGVVVDPDPQCVVVRWALLPAHCEANQACLDWELLRVVSEAEHDERVRRLGGR